MTSPVELRTGRRAAAGEGRHGLERMLPGLRTKLAGARRVAMRQVLVQRLRRIATRPDWLTANQMFGEMQSRAGGSDAAKALLASATLRGARNAEASGAWTIACRFWVWHAAASDDVAKASRNMIRCARAITKERNDGASIRSALEAWSFLFALDAQSAEARQGIVWCNAALARAAEQGGDFSAARFHWAAALEYAPDDETALNGLRTAIEAGSAPQPAAAGGRSDRWRALHKHLTNTARPDHRSQSAAGRALLAAGAPELAIPFLERALRQKASAETALALSRCHLALAQYDRAAATLSAVREMGRLSAVTAQDMRAVLLHASPAGLSDGLLGDICSTFGNRPDVASAAMPLLVTRDFRQHVLQLTDALPDQRGDWPDSTILDTASYLAHSGEQDRALRFLSLFSGRPVIRAAFLTCAEQYEPEVLERVMFAPGDPPERSFGACLAVSEYYVHGGRELRAAETLSRLAASQSNTRPLYERNKHRLSAVFERLLKDERCNPEIRDRIARLIVTWAPESVRSFFPSPAYASVRTQLELAAQLIGAPAESRLGLFREGYFDHHLERRNNQDPAAFEDDFAFCEAVLNYFKAVEDLRVAELVPTPASLRKRLAVSCLPLGSGGAADLLMSYAMFRDRPQIDLKAPGLFERSLGWYVSRFLPSNNVPPNCLSPQAAEYFNAVVHDHSPLGVKVTRFAGFLRSASMEGKRYDLSNGVDALLFTLAAVADDFAANPQYRPFFSAMLPDSGLAGGSLFDACVVALSDPIDTARSTNAPLSQLFALKRPQDAERAWETGGGPLDVLLIGHEGSGTGLGRNFHMLQRALKQEGLVVSTLHYEVAPKVFAEELKAWRDRCRSKPVAIAAINAQDIPALFVRDRHNVLDGCHVAGFFLWETSQVPRVQHLGIRLVDEIWTPTKYVADVYSPFSEVHVVGKGLFSREAWPQISQLPQGGIVRFLTVFDFHSSIERKNPFASVLAFQRAFPSEQNVELVIKASNVNPQHPGNASGQWEKLCAAAEADKRIRLITMRYTEAQMRQLMRSTSCVVSLHRSEGFGYVLSDAIAHGLPVVATAYSGNTDFCDSETSFPVSYRLVPVKSHGAHWESEGAEWAEPDIDSAAAQMRRVYSDYPEALRRAAIARRQILERYSTEGFAATIRARLNALQKPVTSDSDSMHPASP